ncbi:MAG: DUF1255 family protein [Proteobacteria bacterium]|nr:DUF1255 family protein [Pseudomonadota bacterium]
MPGWTGLLREGSKKTLGLMQPGKYELNRVEKEIMEVLAG